MSTSNMINISNNTIMNINNTMSTSNQQQYNDRQQ